MAYLLEDGKIWPIRIARGVAVRHRGCMAPGTAPNRAALSVALYARLYRLLANRPALSDTDDAARIDKAWAAEYPEAHAVIDRVMVEQLTELDRLCGYAVAVMSKRSSTVLLDVLGVLDPLRIGAIYVALPASRRHVVTSDSAWAFHVQRLDLSEIEVAAHFWNELARRDAEPVPDIEAHHQVLRFARESSRYRAGLSYDLTDDELLSAAGVVLGEERT